MKIEQHLNDLAAIGEDLTTFTQEEIDTIFKKTAKEMDSVYVETLSYYINRVKKQRRPVCTLNSLIEKLKSQIADSSARYNVSYEIHVELDLREIILKQGKPANGYWIHATDFVKYLQECRVDHGDLPVYYINKYDIKQPLDLDHISFTETQRTLELQLHL